MICIYSLLHEHPDIDRVRMTNFEVNQDDIKKPDLPDCLFLCGRVTEVITEGEEKIAYMTI